MDVQQNINEAVRKILDAWQGRKNFRRFLLNVVEIGDQHDRLDLDIRLRTPEIELEVSARVNLKSVDPIYYTNVVAAAILLAMTSYVSDISEIMKVIRTSSRVRRDYDFTDDWQRRCEVQYEYIGVSRRNEQTARDIQHFLEMIVTNFLSYTVSMVDADYSLNLAYDESRRMVEFQFVVFGYGVMLYRIPLVPITSGLNRYTREELVNAIVAYFDEVLENLQILIDLATKSLEMESLTIK